MYKQYDGVESNKNNTLLNQTHEESIKIFDAMAEFESEINTYDT